MTAWSLFAINWTPLTALAILLMLVGIGIMWGGIASGIFAKKGVIWGGISIISGFVLLFGVNFVQNVWATTLGKVVFAGIVLVVILGYFLFAEEKVN